jgi:antitoxin (DNA-binding transcriptional repressor) of toxin-antitoxin stability system
MREIQASEAKAHLPQLIDEVERGEIENITADEILSARHEGHKY